MTSEEFTKLNPIITRAQAEKLCHEHCQLLIDYESERSIGPDENKFDTADLLRWLGY